MYIGGSIFERNTHFEGGFNSDNGSILEDGPIQEVTVTRVSQFLFHT